MILRKPFIAIQLVFVIFFASHVNAKPSSIKRFDLPSNGFIEFQVPLSWDSKVQQPPGGLPPTITFFSNSEQSFIVMITPIFSIGPDMNIPNLNDIKQNITSASDRAKIQSVEKKLKIQNIKGSMGSGFYFSATDKAPKPGEFKLLTQGMLRVGELAPTFTVLSNPGSETVVSESLKMIQSAKHIKP